MWFSARFGAETTIRLIAAWHDKLDRFVHFYALLHAIEQCQRSHCTKTKSRIYLAPFVAKEASIGLLQPDNVTHHSITIDLIECVICAQDLHGWQGVQYVRIMTLARCKATGRRALAALHKLNDRFAIQTIQLAHYVQRGNAPVDAWHAQEFCHAIFIIIFLFAMVLNVFDMLPKFQFRRIATLRIAAIWGLNEAREIHRRACVLNWVLIFSY